MTKSDFIDKILVILNEVGAIERKDSAYFGSDNTHVRELVERSFLVGWRRCVDGFPADWFESKPLLVGKSVLTDLYIKDGGRGFVVGDLLYVQGKDTYENSAVVRVAKTGDIGNIKALELLSVSSSAGVVDDYRYAFDSSVALEISDTNIKRKNSASDYPVLFPITEDTWFVDLTGGSGDVFLPSDFYRLGEFRLSGWQRGVCELVNADSHVGRLQSNEYTRGGCSRPVCMQVKRRASSGRLCDAFRYYSLPKYVTAHSLLSGWYIPRHIELFEMQDFEELRVSDKAIEPLVALVADEVKKIVNN